MVILSQFLKVAIEKNVTLRFCCFIELLRNVAGNNEAKSVKRSWPSRVKWRKIYNAVKLILKSGILKILKFFFGFFDAELPLVWQTSSIISAEGKKCVRDPKSTRVKGNWLEKRESERRTANRRGTFSFTIL